MIEGKINAMVGEAILREIIGANPLAAVSRPTMSRRAWAISCCCSPWKFFKQAGPQNLHRFLFILQLGLLVLASNDQPGRQWSNPHRRVGSINALPAMTARPKTSTRKSFGYISHIHLFGLNKTATVAAEV